MALNDLTDEDYARLSEVDKVAELVSKLSSPDSEASALALKEADEYLMKMNGGKNGKINRTVINKSSSRECSEFHKIENNGTSKEVMSAEAFKAQVEADAAERSRRRAEKKSKAEECKRCANEYLKVGDVDTAIQFYSKAINFLPDWSLLYNNRAQAYLLSGRPELALADCDMALRLLPSEPEKSPTDFGADADAAKEANLHSAKACLRRGKALLVLRRPRDALRAYVDSRAYFALTKHPATGVLPDPESDEWPPFLKEHVAQVKAAIAAESLDSESSAKLSSTGNEGPMPLKPTEERFLRLIVEATVRGKDIRHYTKTLRQMASLLSAASVAEGLSKVEMPTNGKLSEAEDVLKVAAISPVSPQGDQKPHTTPNGGKREGKRKGKSNAQRQHHQQLDQQQHQPSKVVETQPANNELATLAKLQSYFRVRNGFRMLQLQMECFDASDVVKYFRRPVDGFPTESGELNLSVDDTLAMLDHLLSLIILANELVRDCGENQRLLVETMPKLFSTLLVDCLNVSSSYAKLRDSAMSSDPKIRITQELQLNHLLGLLQCSACDLIALMSCEASGREGLLTHPGPAVLLSALATCLSDALGLPITNSSPSSTSLFRQTFKLQTSSAQQRSLADCFATQTVAATAKILENITKSPRFFSLVRSSDCFTSLQNVVEAAIAPGPSASTSAPINCLSILLDSLSAASDDPFLRRSMISKPNFLFNLTTCAKRHLPLMVDESHTALVGSICRLIHNFLSGDSKPVLQKREMKALLNLVGEILDTLNCSNLVSVSIALLGRFLPYCYEELVTDWAHSGKEIPQESTNGKAPYAAFTSIPKIKSRVQLLISIICSCSCLSFSSSNLLENVPTPLVPTTVNGVTKVYESTESLTSHRLRGAVHALSAITRAKNCEDVRIAIGDDRLVSRKVAQLLRARATPTCEAEKEAPPYDEPLVASACLILEACVDDTVLAENLIGTTVITDLLKLIKSAKKAQTKKNAGCVIARLCMASHVHREEAHSLNAMSYLQHFNSWSVPSYYSYGHQPGMLF
nr:tetratricopeptide repeat protein 12 [Hymenolepis microstoma]